MPLEGRASSEQQLGGHQSTPAPRNPAPNEERQRGPVQGSGAETPATAWARVNSYSTGFAARKGQWLDAAESATQRGLKDVAGVKLSAYSVSIQEAVAAAAMLHVQDVLPRRADAVGRAIDQQKKFARQARHGYRSAQVKVHAANAETLWDKLDPRRVTTKHEFVAYAIEKASRAITTAAADELIGLDGPNLGTGSSDLAAAAEGDGTAQLQGTREIDVRADPDKSNNTASQSGIVDSTSLIGGDILKDSTAWQTDKAKEWSAWITENLKGGPELGGKPLFGLHGVSLDDGSFSFRFANYKLVPPYPPLAKFATPVTIAPGFGVTFEVSVSASLGVSGGLTITWDEGGKHAKEAFALVRLQQEAKAQQDIASDRDASEEAVAAAKARITVMRTQILERKAALLGPDESMTSVEIDATAAAGLDGEMFLGAFGGFPLANVGLGVYGNLGCKANAGVKIGFDVSSKNGKRSSAAKGSASLMGAVSADLGVKGTYQLVFLSGDIFKVSFADWKLGLIEWAGSGQTNPLQFKKDKWSFVYTGKQPTVRDVVHEQKGKAEGYMAQAEPLAEDLQQKTEILTGGDDGDSVASELHATAMAANHAKLRESQAKAEVDRRQARAAQTSGARDEAQAEGEAAEKDAFETSEAYLFKKYLTESRKQPLTALGRFRLAGEAILGNVQDHTAARAKLAQADQLAEQLGEQEDELARARTQAETATETMAVHRETLEDMVAAGQEKLDAARAAHARLVEEKMQALSGWHRLKKTARRSAKRSLVDTVVRKAAAFKTSADEDVARLTTEVEGKVAEITKKRTKAQLKLDYAKARSREFQSQVRTPYLARLAEQEIQTGVVEEMRESHGVAIFQANITKKRAQAELKECKQWRSKAQGGLKYAKKHKIPELVAERTGYIATIDRRIAALESTIATATATISRLEQELKDAEAILKRINKAVRTLAGSSMIVATAWKQAQSDIASAESSLEKLDLHEAQLKLTLAEARELAQEAAELVAKANEIAAEVGKASATIESTAEALGVAQGAQTMVR